MPRHSDCSNQLTTQALVDARKASLSPNSDPAIQNVLDW